MSSPNDSPRLASNDLLATNSLLSSSFPHDVEPAEDIRIRTPEEFILSGHGLSPTSRPSTLFPRSLKLTVWNCRGIQSKIPEIRHVMNETQCDILILTETFRFPGCPWPAILPACLAESTATPTESASRNSAGVAVLVNPNSIKKERIKSFTLVEVDRVHGTKVIVKINNFTLIAVYTPPNPLGTDLLREYSDQARTLALNSEPVVFAGDFNAHSSLWGSPTPNEKGSILSSLFSHNFFRANTGPEPTRPASRIDAVVTEGSIIDHILGKNVDLCQAKCHSLIAQTSDHRPISATIVPIAQRASNSTKYWRINLLKLHNPETRQRYIDKVAEGSDSIFDSMCTLSSHAVYSAPLEARRALVDCMEMEFTTWITNAAKATLGLKNVPLVPGSRRTKASMSDDYINAREELRGIFLDLSRHSSLTSDHPVIADLLERRDAVKTELNNIRLRDNRHSFQKYAESASKLPPQVLIKRISASRRRKAAAGASLSSTSVALESYGDHFARQFINTHTSRNPIPLYCRKAVSSTAQPILLMYLVKKEYTNVSTAPPLTKPQVSPVSRLIY